LPEKIAGNIRLTRCLDRIQSPLALLPAQLFEFEKRRRLTEIVAAVEHRIECPAHPEVFLDVLNGRAKPCARREEETASLGFVGPGAELLFGGDLVWHTDGLPFGEQRLPQISAALHEHRAALQHEGFLR
jgi:hypothetical protein